MDRKITYGVILALAVQMMGGLLWAGAAAQRLTHIEKLTDERGTLAIRLAQVETELAIIRGQLARIEAKLDKHYD